jgi:hypothetical protein
VTTLALLIAALLAAACVIYVARPFLREPEPADDDRLDDLGELERRRLELAEERDRALAALKELEFDHRTGSVSDEDYRAAVGPLRRQAAAALRSLEPEARPAGRRFGQRAAGETGHVAAPVAVEVPGEPVVPEPSRVPEPYPPGELTPPEPPAIPEPYPPPDEGSPPVPPLVPEPYPPGESRR